MATELLCDPCSLESKNVKASRYCSDCEEHLCKDCAEFHTRFKAFRSHHIIDLKSLKSDLPKTNKICEIHPNILLEFFCTQHDIICCRACIADTHRSCDKILPLDVASKDIKISSLMLDSLSSVTDFIATLDELLRNRNDSLDSLQKTKSKIIQQISNAKLEQIKQLNQIEEKLIADVSTIEKKGKSAICEQKSTLSGFHVACNKNKEDLEFLKEHGSNTQLFLYLRQTIKSMETTEAKVKRLSSSFMEIDIEFHKTETIEKHLIGSVSETKMPCKVEYKPKVIQQAQTEVDTITSWSKCTVDGEIDLKSGERYNISGIAITLDNNLLLCNYCADYPNVYMYNDECVKETKFSTMPYDISVMPATHKAVVTLPGKESIQYINTTDLTKGDKVHIGMEGYGVYATKDKIFVGGRGVIKILDSIGTDINTIRIRAGDIKSLFYDENNAIISCRCDGILVCCKVDGTVLYQYKSSGYRGLSVDRQGNVYVALQKTKEIHRVSPDGKFLDVFSTTKSPDVLTFNNDYSKLFVVTDNSITIIKCK